MCSSEGVSVWFACKLCKSFFLNADDFAYHKKKSHLQEFRHTKFIVFEERSTPTISPPENWVSFLSPKEETKFHKIISSTITNVDCNSPKDNTENCTNKEITDEIGSESRNDFNEGGDSFEKRDKKQFPSLIVPHSLTKSTTIGFKRNKSQIQNVPFNNENQTAAQSLRNPYVYLKRLNLRSIPNTSSQSQCKSTTHSDENGTCNKTQSTHGNIVNLPQVTTAENQIIHNRINSAAVIPPLLMTSVDCKFCSEHFNSTAERDIHQDICRLKRQFENILCVPCLLTFASSDELHAHNQEFHSTPFPTSDATKHRKPDADDEVGAPKTKTKIEPVSEPTISSNEDLTLDPSASAEVNISYGDLLDVVKTEFTADGNENSEFPGSVDTDPLESESQVLLKSPPAEEAANVALSPSNGSDGNHEKLLPAIILPHSTERPFKCPYPNCVMSFKTSMTRYRHLRTVHLASSSCEAETPKDTLQSGLFRFRYCFACKENFASNQELTKHNQNYHGIQLGEQKFVCPYPNCGKTAKTRRDLTAHLLHVHSNQRPFKCSYPNCKAAFKSSSNLNKHSRRAHPTPGSSSSNPSDGIRKDKESVECPYPNCGKIVSSKWNLKTHIQQVHLTARPYQGSTPQMHHILQN